MRETAPTVTIANVASPSTFLHSHLLIADIRVQRRERAVSADFVAEVGCCEPRSVIYRR